MLLLGLVGVLAGVALPFAPVWADTTTLTWPAPGQAARSSSVAVVPYRPADLRATIPCSALRAAGPTAIVLATGTGPDGLVVTGDSVRFDGHTVALPQGGLDCSAVVTANTDGVSVLAADGRRTDLTGQPVPQVFGFHTDLSQADATGLAVTIRVTDPFGTSPGAVKIALIVVQLLAAGSALVVLCRPSRRRGRDRQWRSRFRWRPAWWVDVAVVVVFAVWAVIGPLAVDDGWATMIARNVADTGSPGNYYRWWNASEVPFALDQQLLSPLTEVSLAPLWLRLPSTVLAIATWFVLSRGVLGAALPVRATTIRVRLLAAACLLASWLPFNLGTRPESYVALGVTVVLALAMRSRGLAGLAFLILTAAVTAPISPNSVLVLAPILVFAPRLLTALRASSPTRWYLLAHVVLLCCVAAVGLSVIFSDQTWDALTTATDWHTFFGPSLPWHEEPVRYRYLLQPDQQGSFAKRLPVLLAIAMLPLVGLLAARRPDRDVVGRAASRMAAVTLAALLLFAVSPSKWSYHFGAAAGLFATLLTVGVVLVARRARVPDRYRVGVAMGGSVLLTAVVMLAFEGPNAWWLPAVYDVQWPTEPPRPLGISLNSPLPWLVVAVVATALLAIRRGASRALTASPVVIVTAALGVVLALLLGSFADAPLRRPEGSLAMANLHRLSGSARCGLADDVQVLPDGPPLTVASGVDQLSGFAALAGFAPGAPPPDAPGTGTSAHLWGSRAPDDRATGGLTSAWFTLPPQPANGGVAVSVSGRTGDGNELVFEAGRSTGAGVDSLGERTPIDRPAPDEDPAHPLWRTIGVDAADLPVGTDRIRIRASDGRSDPLGWLAVTGPRLRTIVGLDEFLADGGPVLLSWPQAFLFSCVRDVVRVRAGVATLPRTVIESPRPTLDDDRKRDIGGVFAALMVFGHLHEVPSRLVGHPEVDWGSVLVSDDAAGTVAYQRTVTRALVPGDGGVAHAPPEH